MLMSIVFRARFGIHLRTRQKWRATAALGDELSLDNRNIGPDRQIH
ncbi:hypothetical protein [Mycobacterium simiae]|nr:hypothetical protein [Mycobacterium simiae]